MKTSKLSFVIIAICTIAMTSCVKSTQTFTVQGKPGTSITTPKGEHIAMIDGTGQAKIQLKRNQGYYPYMLAKEPNSTKNVPFALDYKDKKRYKKGNILVGVGFPLGILGASFAITGAIVSKGDDKIGPIFAGAGAGAMLASIWPLVHGSKLQSQDYQYDYLPMQKTNNDLIH